LNRYKEDIRLFGKQNLSEECMAQLQHDTELRFIAIITSKRLAVDKKERPIAFLMVEDMYSSIEVAVFSREFDKFAPLIEVDNVVYITGRYTKRERGNSMIVTNIERIENLREKFQNKLRLRLNIKTDQLQANDLSQMETLFELNKGNTLVKLAVYSTEASGPINMNLRNFVVDPSDELLKGLRDVLGEESVSLEFN
jgi:DNA polymerase-3 subunit alpha